VGPAPGVLAEQVAEGEGVDEIQGQVSTEARYDMGSSSMS
jgi:hypothetical protein